MKHKAVLTEEEQTQLVEQSRRFAAPEQAPEIADFWGQVQEYLDRNPEKSTT